MTKTTYTICAPIRSTMVFHVEAEKGLTHNEICNLVSNDDLAEAEVEIDWHDIEDSWNEDWHLKSSCPFDLTYIEDESGNEVEITLSE